MGSKTSPNRAFARALEDAGISHKRLAFEVRVRALRDGKELSTDHNYVRRWLDGVQPKEEPARYVAEVLADRLGRPVTPASLGFTACGSSGTAELEGPTVAGSVQYLSDAAAATSALSVVVTEDADDENAPLLRSWDVHASPGIISGFLFDPPSPRAATAIDSEPISATAIRQMTGQLMALDFQLGGGQSRDLLLAYMRTKVLPGLSKVAKSQIASDIYSATAELAQMLGWSAYDSGRHGAAQRYLVHGLRLAREAGDHRLGAFLLSSLSHQANYLGYFRDAAQLARAGQHEAAAGGSSTVESMLFTYEARALASLGDSRGCAGALHRAEVSFDAGQPGDDPEWLSFFDAAELAGEAAHCFRDLHEPMTARPFCVEAVASAATPPRTRAFLGLVTAMTAFHAGEIDEAVATATAAVNLAGPIDSDRYRRYVSDFVRATTAQRPENTNVADFVALTASLTRATS